MNVFVPENPTVVLQISLDGTAVIRKANNIDKDLQIILVKDKTEFDKEAAGRPFNNTLPTQPHQVLAQGVH